MDEELMILGYDLTNQNIISSRILEKVSEISDNLDYSYSEIKDYSFYIGFVILTRDLKSNIFEDVSYVEKQIKIYEESYRKIVSNKLIKTISSLEDELDDGGNIFNEEELNKVIEFFKSLQKEEATLFSLPKSY